MGRVGRDDAGTPSGAGPGPVPTPMRPMGLTRAVPGSRDHARSLMIGPASPTSPPPSPEDDPLVVALGAAAKALEDRPSILREKKAEWTGGLNLDTVNALVAEADLLGGRVGERVVEKGEGGEVTDRGLRFFHPNGRDELQVWTWGTHAQFDSPARKAPAIVALLRAWREERLTQLATPAEDWFTLDVLEGRRTTVRLEMPGEGDRARELASRLRAVCAEARHDRVGRRRRPRGTGGRRATGPGPGPQRGGGRQDAGGRCDRGADHRASHGDGASGPEGGEPPRTVAPCRVLLSRTEEDVYSFLAKAFQEERRPTYDDAQAEGWTRKTYSKALKALDAHRLIERKKGRPVRVFPRESAR